MSAIYFIIYKICPQIERKETTDKYNCREVDIHREPHRLLKYTKHLKNHGGRAYRCMCPMRVENLKGKVATTRINSIKNLNSTTHKDHAFALYGVGAESKTLTTQVPQLQC